MVSLLFFGAYDNATQKELADPQAIAAQSGGTVDPSKISATRVERVLFASEFHRADLRWDHDFASGAHTRVAATLGYDRTRVEAKREGDDLMTGFRASLEAPVGKRLVVILGGDVTLDHYGG